MAHAIIYKIGSDNIFQFVENCVQDGSNFIGSKRKILGVKLDIFSVKWTNEDREQKQKVSQFAEARRFNSKVVSTREDVNEVTQERIKEKYSLEDELKILRLKLSGDTADWSIYITDIEILIEEGKQFKDENFPKNP